MDKEQIQKLQRAAITAFDEVMKEKLAPMIGQEVATTVQKTVATLKLQREKFGKDMTGLSDKAKKDFVEVAQAVLRGKFNNRHQSQRGFDRRTGQPWRVSRFT